MCFSPEASFIATAFLAIVSIVSLVKIKQQGREQRKKLALIFVPIGFAAQQFCEGFVWLSLLHNYSDLVRNMATYGFIFFAYIFWPVYVSWCMYYLEQNEVRKDVLAAFNWIGIFVATVLLIHVAYFGVAAQATSCHIMYSSGIAEWSFVTISMMITYLIATVGSLLISSFSGIRTLGVMVGITYIIAYGFYVSFFVSVWCFFAAVTSLCLYKTLLKSN